VRSVTLTLKTLPSEYIRRYVLLVSPGFCPKAILFAVMVPRLRNADLLLKPGNLVTVIVLQISPQSSQRTSHEGAASLEICRPRM